jgi:hypothetical protein
MEKRITIFNQEQYDGDWVPEKLSDALQWLQLKLQEIPAEYRDSAIIEIDSAGGYEGSHYGHIEIHYTRPETDNEILLRETQNAHG